FINPGTARHAMSWVNEAWSADITLDHGDGVNRRIVLGGPTAMKAPIGANVGWPLNLWLVQDGTGGRTVAWNNVFDFGEDGPPDLSVGANQADLLTFICLDTSKFVFLGIRNRVD